MFATSKRIKSLLILPALLATLVLALGLLNLANRVYFQMTVGLFTVVISFCIFILAWNSRNFTENRSLTFLGAAYTSVGLLDMFHLIAYMGITGINDNSADQSAQFWIAARYVEGISLLLFTRIRNRNEYSTLFIYGIITFFFTVTILYWKVFPTCFIEGTGFTAFKRYSEYLISALLFVSLILILIRRKQFDLTFVIFLSAGILAKALSEIIIATFADVNGIMNFSAHIARAASFYLVYKAVIHDGLMEPFDIFAEDINEAKQEQLKAVEHIEGIVKQRTTELRETKEEHQLLTGKLLGLQEEELEHISNQLHHDITQRLGFLAIEIGKTQINAPNANISDLQENLARVNEVIGDLSNLTNNMSYQLHPTRLYELGLVEAVRYECKIQSFHYRDIDMRCQVENLPKRLPAKMAICVYRIIQESLRNACEHSGCSQIEVFFSDKPNTLTIEIRDNGSGFDPEKVNIKDHHCIGIALMRKRAALIRAKLDIITVPDKGTTVSLLVVKPEDKLKKSEAFYWE
ncbi:Sensor histidine kinase ComP [Limihaloglobus sulfuriphilus]|uniref:histidine kinase n=1 Tax=Limihaloglobus sulfuriphilus TaxID=1851148 RepID=A0A1Q2MC35_9BACT|nr:MASE3 domain-containing protein [Limihaloglobus sulfuriphilus]AQQ69837.1 Sensor histidine kinase ComP [Limihaloglobus sulfuriphilus]